jgi:hypothetical protein
MSFSYIDWPKWNSEILLLVKAIGHPYCMRITPIPFPEASHCRKKVFLKSGRARTGVVHIDYLK